MDPTSALSILFTSIHYLICSLEPLMVLDESLSSACPLVSILASHLTDF